jgi:hypothetical protein
MAILGNNTTPSAGFDFIGSSQAAATQFTMPSGGGVVTSISGYFDSESASQNGYLCVWDGSGNVLVQSSAFAINNKSGSGAGGQDWWTQSISNVYVPAGTVWIGFIATGSLVFSSESGGASNVKAMSSPSSFSGSSSSGVGAVGAYITYTPGGVGQVYSGSAWTDGVLVQVYNGSAWVQANPQVYNGSVWVITT